MTANPCLRLAPVLALTACATGIPTDTRTPDEFRENLTRPRAARLASAAGIFDGRGELRLDADAAWLPIRSDSGLALTLGAGLVRHRDAWAGIRTAARWSAATRFRPYAELGAGAGTGVGAGRSLSAGVGAAGSHLRVEFRSVRYTEITETDAGFLPGSRADPDSASRAKSYSDAELTTLFGAGRFSFEVLGGVRLTSRGPGTSTWANAMVVARLGPRLELQVSGGRRPDRLDLGEPGGSFYRVGLAVRTRRPVPAILPPVRPPEPPAALVVTPLEDGAWSVTVRIPEVKSVEISGDMTSWSPLPLHRSRSDPATWFTRFEAGAGIYLVVMRLDGGAWRPPPGLPVVPDGFGGQAGLLEINRNRYQLSQEHGP